MTAPDARRRAEDWLVRYAGEETFSLEAAADEAGDVIRALLASPPPGPAAASDAAFAAFGRALLPKWWDDGNPGDIDGGDVQDAAEAAGLWCRVERHADGVECEWCGGEGPCGELTETGRTALGASGGSR